MSQKYEYQDQCQNPRVFLEGMDNAEAEKGNHITNYSDDDDSDCNSHLVVRHRAENLSSHNKIDHHVSTANYDIEDGAELCAPETEGVSRRRHFNVIKYSNSQVIKTFRSNYLL